MAKILIVDDAAFMRMMLGNILKNAGHEIVGEAQNGKDGVELYSKLHPDIITLDITMPELDGLSALKLIRDIDVNAKVVMCSAMGQKAMVIEAIQNGAKDFIVKPFDAKKIVSTIEKLC